MTYGWKQEVRVAASPAYKVFRISLKKSIIRITKFYSGNIQFRSEVVKILLRDYTGYFIITLNHY